MENIKNIENIEATQEKKWEKIAEENFSRWNDAVKAGDPKEVAKLYAEDATFLPTLSGEFKEGPEGAEEYFENFLKKNPSGEIIEGKIQILGGNFYMHSGMYNFEVGPDNDRQIAKARFSFGWRQDEQGKDEQGEWKIFHHHSSMKPE